MKSNFTFVYVILLALSIVQQAKSYQGLETPTEDTHSQVLVIEENKALKEKAEAVQSKLNNMMQDTAAWLDNIYTDKDDASQEGASANGYVQLGWMPRTGDLADFDPKFKVRLSLPRWNNKVALVLDNDDEDELQLDYEAAPIGQDNEDEELNIAIQYAERIGDLVDVKYRLGLSRGQLYARSEIKKRWRTEDYSIEIVPRLDYFYSDGWAPSIKSSVTIPIGTNILSFSASWQKVEKEDDSRQKIGLYYVGNISAKKQWVSGIQYTNNKYSQESLFISYRLRNLIHKDWLFIEFEPFIEFRQERDYRRDFGMAIRLITYYGSN